MFMNTPCMVAMRVGQRAWYRRNRFGRGAPVPQPACAPTPVTSMPDRVDTNDQKDYLNDLKAGIKGPDMKVNPGRKRW